MDRKLFEDVKCNYCGNNNYDIVIKDQYDKEKQGDLKDKFKSSGDETLIDQVVKCKKCDLMYITPRIKSKLIIEGYSEGDDEAFASQAKGREITFKRNLNILEKTLKNNKLRYPGKILDIGTANGSFLHVAKDAGWDAYGIEPNKWLCNWAKRNYSLNVKPGTIFDNKFKDEFFDVVTLWDVLEHVPDPTKMLKECNRILKKNGVLAVNYPDVGSLPARLLGKKWVFYLSVHLYYFTRQTLAKMLRKNGYEVILIKPHFQSLQLGYLVKRSKAYSNIGHDIGQMFVNLTRTNNFQIKYWVGQTLMIAKKR